MRTLVAVDGETLTVEAVEAVARHPDGPRAVLPAKVRSDVKRVRDAIEVRWLCPDAPLVYGFNTGCGVLKDYPLDPEQQRDFNARYIRSHSVGIGEPLPAEVVRAALLLRANSFAKGRSGVRPQLIERLLELLAAEVIPVVPRLGSLGASGDLAPLAHIASVVVGEPQAEAVYRGRRMSALEALAGAGLEPLPLEAKEALALTNGTTVSSALSVFNVINAARALEAADVIAALSLEAICGERAAFDERLHLARAFPGQLRTARRINELTEGSRRMTAEGRRRWAEAVGGKVSPRIQDAYSFRCIPQIHGPLAEVLEGLLSDVKLEINSATDNPLVFPTEEGWEALGGGNFFGQQLAVANDSLAIALAKVAQASERRTFRLLNPQTSFGLSEQLTGGKPGLNTGLMILHYSQAAVVAECVARAQPASVQSAVTSGGQEDVVSFSMTAAWKAREAIDLLFEVLAIEAQCAAQGISLSATVFDPADLGLGTLGAYRSVRSVVAELGDDRFLQPDQARLAAHLRAGGFDGILPSGHRAASATGFSPAASVWKEAL